ncbi:hypothetical protein BJY01DRAFT_212431 [Aspergillus pseudoustus]|uniref:F-box domain-containing protein n=1 Tax=Aspergillus pseudoustus TaxID=1810923 RepID=A0ABR4K662_9EURO
MSTRRKRTMTNTANNPRLDPLAFLNADIIYIIISYLPVGGVVCLERVSRSWRDLMREWMIKLGTRYIIQPTWHPAGLTNPMKPLPYPEFKEHARSIHRMQSGLLSSAHKFEDAAYFSVSGQYAVWVLKSDTHSHRLYDPSIQDTPSDIIYWRTLSKDAPKRPVKTVDVLRLWRPGRDAVFVNGLFVNDDGIIIVSLTLGRQWHRRERVVVFSLVENSVLWSRDSEVVMLAGIVPIAIGASHFYAAIWNPIRQRYLLLAEDFQTGEQAHMSDVLSSDWRWADRDSNDNLEYGWGFANVVKVSNGVELLLQLKSVAAMGVGEIEIFRGSDGTLVGCTPCTNTGVNSVLSHPPTGHIAFTSEVTRMPQLHGALDAFGRYRIFVTRRFSYDETTGMRLLCSDVVLIPQDWLIRPNGCPWSPVSIDPFNRVAFVSSAQKPEEEHSDSSWTVWSCPLVLAEDPDLCDAAVAAMHKTFAPSELASTPAVASRCYVLSNGTQVTLPASPEKRRKERVPLMLPSPMGQWLTRGAGSQVLFLVDDEYYVLNFC